MKGGKFLDNLSVLLASQERPCCMELVYGNTLTKFYLENMNGRDHLVGISVDVRIILKLILNK
jgi:hypothetical protein